MRFLTAILLIVFSAALFASEVKFKKAKLKINQQVLTVELAETPQQQTQGLMYRKSISNNSGMLFIFKDSQVRSFWMKNTFVNLSIGYFDRYKKLIDIQDMSAAKSEMQTDFPTYQSQAPAQYALEVHQGWFAKHKIKLGDHFELIR